MAQQTIDIGAAPNDGTGDPIRDAFDKCNDNFNELYVAGGAAWTELEFWDFAVDGAVANVDADVSTYDEVMIIADEVTCSAANFRGVNISTDGAATWITGTTSGYREVSNAGTVAVTHSLFLHATGTASARSGHLILHAIRGVRRKWASLVNRGGLSGRVEATNAAITDVRVAQYDGNGVLTGTMTGGTIQILAR